MVDFSALREKQVTIGELAAGLTVADLRRLSDESVDEILGLIADCTDADVVFQPVDPDAHDAYATDESEKDIAWTLGHVVVHCTASAEEAAALAADSARPMAHLPRSHGRMAGRGRSGHPARPNRGPAGRLLWPRSGGHRSARPRGDRRSCGDRSDRSRRW